MDIIYVSFALFIAATAYQYLKPKEERKFTSLNTEEAYEKIRGERAYYIVDVRRRDEFKKGHLRKAKNIPLDDFTNRLNKIPRNKDVIIYCDMGSRSIRAVRYLEVAGHERIYHMHEGMRGWRKAGHPVA